MSGQFEAFVQQELPLRGFLSTDVPQETIIIRRGPGPRQFDAVTLSEGEALGMVNGVITSMQIGIKKHQMNFTASTHVVVPHGKNSTKAMVQVFDDANSNIIPESIVITDANTITITFNSNVSGTVNILFL